MRGPREPLLSLNNKPMRIQAYLILNQHKSNNCQGCLPSKILFGKSRFERYSGQRQRGPKRTRPESSQGAETELGPFDEHIFPCEQLLASYSTGSGPLSSGTDPIASTKWLLACALFAAQQAPCLLEPTQSQAQSGCLLAPCLPRSRPLVFWNRPNRKHKVAACLRPVCRAAGPLSSGTDPIASTKWLQACALFAAHIKQARMSPLDLQRLPAFSRL